MSRLRKRVSERLKGAQNTFALLTTFNEVDMTNLMELRKKYKVLRILFIVYLKQMKHVTNYLIYSIS